MSKKAYSYIRFSTPEQLKGDSLRRQLEASRAYAKQHGLILDESLRDMGISAFKGKNATEGALKKFIELVEAGQIEKGSILILESLDRLSRQQIFSALSLFSSILSAGVEIVTLADNQHYTIESMNDVGQLMFSLISMSRSHEESAMKSRRSGASWEQKRKRAEEQNIPMTGKCPLWLKLSKDKKKFKVIEERAEVVRYIFEQSIAGLGRRKIASNLNKQGVPVFGRAKIWYTSYIHKMLESRSVMGEYQPCSHGEEVGEVISGYYPAIISETDFYKANTSRLTRKNTKSAGRKGKKFSNLFSGMCKCLECGTTYRFMGDANSANLHCDNYYVSGGCENKKKWKYRDVENAALIIISEKIDWFSALGGHTSSKQKLESEVACLNTKLANAEQQVSRFASLFGEADGAMLIDAKKRYLKAMAEVGSITEEIDGKQAELQVYTPAQQNVERLNQAIFALDSEEDETKLYELRTQINAVFKNVELRLYFNEHGVYYYVGSTKQKGILLTNENEELISMAAELDRVQLHISGMNTYIEEINK